VTTDAEVLDITPQLSESIEQRIIAKRAEAVAEYTNADLLCEEADERRRMAIVCEHEADALASRLAAM
jgi:hypothetical protein